MDWAALEVAGAFIVGVIVGAVAVARITRAVMDYLNGQRDR